MDIEGILSKLTLEQKASLLVGHTNMTTMPIEELGIPSLVMSDGPNGVRKEGEGGAVDVITNTLPATCFPSGSSLACSWDNELLFKVGKQIGKECKRYKTNAILGPGVNIKRNPLCGRNFEYYSEDPILAGKLAASYINGVQSEGVLACIKHYACNDLEEWRYIGDSVVDLRALNDIYLKPFEIAVKESNPGMIMTAYNQINGTFASENEYLIRDRLLNKFGFKGLSVTDWGGLVHRDLSLNAGQDIEMPGQVPENVQKIIDGVNSGLIDIKTVDASVRKLLEAIEKTRTDEVLDDSVFEESKQVALQAALEGAVLLKNKGNLLPLDKIKRYVVAGDLFSEMRYQGGGSSLVSPYFVLDNKTAFDNAGIDYIFKRGYNINSSKVNLTFEEEALKASKDIQNIIFFMGLDDLSESEGYDRKKDMKVPENQIHLLKRLVKLNKHITLMLYGGAPFEIPEVDDVDAILYMNLTGEMSGEALRQLLFGEVSPSGRLAYTWMKSYEDVPFGKEFTSSPVELYKESIYVGYRYYSSVGKEVLYPFGYGLTYGRNTISDIHIKQKEDHIDVGYTLTNKSEVEAVSVIQVYVGHKGSNIPHPLKELKGYARTALKPGEREDISLSIKVADLAFYDMKTGEDVLEDGQYIIYVSENVNNDYYKEEINISGTKLECREEDKPYLDPHNLLELTNEQYEKFLGRPIPVYKKQKPYTFETPIAEYKSFFGSIVKSLMMKQGDKIIKKAKKIKDEKERTRLIKSGTFIKKMMSANCLRSLVHSSGGIVTYESAQGILDVANGKLISGMKKLKNLKGI